MLVVFLLQRTKKPVENFIKSNFGCEEEKNGKMLSASCHSGIHVFQVIRRHGYRLSVNRSKQINIGEFIFPFYHMLNNFTVSDCGRLHKSFHTKPLSIIRLYGVR